ncbi:MAG: hypothetical protein QGH39_01395 [Candidatus Thermoplasmatota archaeon]|jgi:hypothetical protein|nr:hypothetical protein [Candidatus Thermoplasmatota archaeon]MDP7264194.1 hypothetical protein [Candidatus Thermoplasmatota archaeon]
MKKHFFKPTRLYSTPKKRPETTFLEKAAQKKKEIKLSQLTKERGIVNISSIIKRGQILLITSILLMNVLFLLPSLIFMPVKALDVGMDTDLSNAVMIFSKRKP